MEDRLILTIFRLASFSLIFYAMLMLLEWHIEYKKVEAVASNLISVSVQDEVISKSDYPYININFSYLKKQSSDVVGWIKVNDTNINYAVVQGEDNYYYLNHDINHNMTQVGWVFMDYANNSEELEQNTTIYAHNRLDGSMFGSLKNLLNTEWHNKNKYIYFNTEDKTMTWEVYSVYMIPKEDYISNTTFESDTKYSEFIENTQKMSAVNLNVDVSTNDKILTLYTCDNTNNNRVIVHAKLVFSK